VNEQRLARCYDKSALELGEALARAVAPKSSRSIPKDHFVLIFLSSLGLALLCFVGSFFLSIQRDPTPMMKEMGPGLLAIFKYFCAGIIGLIGGKGIK
jgi:hypothetical protein